jgi:hypothetical protein
MAGTPFGGDDLGTIPSDSPKGPVTKCESGAAKGEGASEGERELSVPGGASVAENPSVVALFKTSQGTCWGASFATATENTAREFKAVSSASGAFIE